MNKKVCLISLGCAKNLVDSEMILGLIKKMGYENTPFKSHANLIIINTCGFILSAKTEAINTILDVVNNKKDGQKVLVCGCLATRYKEDLIKEMPEVDAFVSIKEYNNLDRIISSLFNEEPHNYCLSFLDRVLATPPYTAYVRIGDGCDNNCSYCAIPLIRGGFNSRKIKDVVNECKLLVEKGIKELVLIAQDTTRFGIEINERIEDLLKEVEKLDVKSIRLLYLYPDEISDELIDIISSSSKICHYFDIPVQHASNKILKYMNRRGTKQHILSIIKKIRNKCEDAIIRTTVMVGFPYESRKDYKELVKFIEDVKFDRLGCFTYSPEEDTKGYNMPQIKENIKIRRYNHLMKVQKRIAKQLSIKQIGKTYECFIDSIDNKYYKVRNYAYSGDGVDGYIYVLKDNNKHKVGDTINVKIIGENTYDLIGKLIK